MIDLFPFSGLTVGVMGLGPHGTAVARALLKSGAEAWAWDDSPDRRAAAAEGLRVVDLATCDWGDLLSLVIEPDVPHRPGQAHAAVARARDAGIEVIADTELLVRAQRDASYVGVTGSADGDFVCELLAHVFAVAGREVEMGGTGGQPVIDLHPLEIGGTYVLAMAPEKLDITFSITFDIAIWLGANDTVDGDRMQAMRQIFHRQTGLRSAIVSVDDAQSRALHDDLATRGEQVVIPVSALDEAAAGVYMEDGMLIDARQGTPTPVIDLGEFETFAGDEHKFAAAAVYAAAVSGGIEPRVAMACLQSF
jgi:UDP-N-acetylmuramoylalanine--D-glutamate ligase